MKNNRTLQRLKRHRRILLKIKGTQDRPRLIIFRSLKNFSAQAVDDINNRTLFSLSTLDKEVKDKFPYGGNVKAAGFLGEVFAARAKEKGLTCVVFDRAGYLYHGRVKTFADALRKGGLKF